MALLKQIRNLSRLEDITAVTIIINVFWDVTPCSQFKVHRRFGGQ
jgi:hypothetical protein